MNIPEDLLQFKLTRKNKPGSDKISRLIANDQWTVDTITTAFLRVPKGTYISTSTCFVDGTECDILYVPRSAELSSLPPVIMEIQHSVSKESMTNAIQYCLNIYRRFHVHPVLIIICIEKIGSKTLANEFTPTEDMPFCLETACTHWARHCFLLSKTSIDTLVLADGTQPLDPLVAFVHFLTSGQQSIISIDRWDDPTIQLLYRLAKDICKADVKEENSRSNALVTICEATGSQFAKIAKAITTEPKKAIKYAEAGHLYSTDLKRRYDQYESQDSPGNVTPMEEPAPITMSPQQKSNKDASTSTSITSANDLFNFVERYKQTHGGGRMDWSGCWSQGRKEGIFKEYGNSASLKSSYYRISKSPSSK